VYDRASGRSQLGASTLWQADLFDWLAEKGRAGGSKP
jgi:hypothetical protein